MWSFVLVAPAQIISLIPTSVSRPLNANTTVTCLYTGIPEPEAHWYHDGIELLSDGKTMIDTTIGMSTLTIQNLTRNDSGVYECSVSNEKTADMGGNDTAILMLNVYSKSVRCIRFSRCLMSVSL